eukprot:scaffold62693_cov69-Phaeocystis_antarctica.AAC.2
MLTAPPPAARCGAAPTSSPLHPGHPDRVAALCGESQMWARGSAHIARPSPRPRRSAKPQTPGSAPPPSSCLAAR